MSWQERLENIKFTITTGDGKKFTPLWKNGTKSKDYNVSSYNFIDVPGGYTDRKKPQAGKFPLVFWFQGDDNIEQAQAFEDSADDPRPWEVKHPLYGNIKGQPLSIKRDDSAYNTTQVSVDFWESISKEYPNPQSSIEDVVRSKVNSVSTVSAQAYSSRLIAGSEDQQIMQQNIVQVSSTFDKLYDDDNFSEYQQTVDTALNAASNLTSNSNSAIFAAHNLLLQPSLFSKPVKDRVSSFVNSFKKIKETLEEYNTVATKLFFETQAGVCIASLCQSASTPLHTDYVTRLQIEEITNIIVESYVEYLDILDNSQVPIENVQNAYHPAAESQFDLYDLVVETTGNLFALAFEAKQQRVIETETETNLILLTHRFLGLDANDENIEEFRQLNNIKNDELLRIKKAREIKYFV